MHTDSTHVMPWRIEDIDLSRIDRRKAASNEHLLLLLCAASFIESGTDLYTSNLSTYFNDDPEVSDWLNNEWEPEEMQHGRALKTYIHHVWPEFDWDTAFKNFFAEYSLTCSVEDFEKRVRWKWSRVVSLKPGRPRCIGQSMSARTTRFSSN